MKTTLKYSLSILTIMSTCLTHKASFTAEEKLENVHQISITIVNNTNEKFTIMSNTNTLSTVQAQSTTPKLNIPLKFDSQSGVIEPKSNLKLVNTTTKKEYPFDFAVSFRDTYKLAAAFNNKRIDENIDLGKQGELGINFELTLEGNNLQDSILDFTARVK